MPLAIVFTRLRANHPRAPAADRRQPARADSFARFMTWHPACLPSLYAGLAPLPGARYSIVKVLVRPLPVARFVIVWNAQQLTSASQDCPAVAARHTQDRAAWRRVVARKPGVAPRWGMLAGLRRRGRHDVTT